ncbi:MAG: hypothetical protein FJW85_00620 [Actinobacteria bacterium]|nr:hypothetical protein [Actinomycetota bacterium]
MPAPSPQTDGSDAPDTPGQTLAVPPTPPEAGTERFDDLIQVVRPWMKAALGVSVITILGVLLWATFASISTSVTSTGGLVPATGFVPIVAVSPGTLQGMTLVEGDTVQVGQRIGQVTTVDGQVRDLTSPVKGTVAAAFYAGEAEVPASATILLVVQEGDQRSVVTFLAPQDASSLTVDQPAVFSAPDCPSYTGAVSAVLRAPLTEEQIADRLGLAGLAEVIAPPGGGVGVLMNVDASWCPTLAYGSTGSLVITTGTGHPIEYLQP